MGDEIAKVDADGYFVAVVEPVELCKGRPRYPGESFSHQMEFHECIPKRYIDSEEGVTGLHCDRCGLIWTREPLPNAKILADGRLLLDTGRGSIKCFRSGQ